MKARRRIGYFPPRRQSARRVHSRGWFSTVHRSGQALETKVGRDFRCGYHGNGWSEAAAQSARTPRTGADMSTGSISPMPPPPSRIPRRRPIGLGCAILVMLLMVIAIVAGIINSVSDDESDATPTPVARTTTSDRSRHGETQYAGTHEIFVDHGSTVSRDG